MLAFRFRQFRLLLSLPLNNQKKESQLRDLCLFKTFLSAAN